MSDEDEGDKPKDSIISFPDFGAHFGLNAEDMMQLANARRLPFTREYNGEYYVRSRDVGSWGVEAYAEQLKRLGMDARVVEREGLNAT